MRGINEGINKWNKRKKEESTYYVAWEELDKYYIYCMETWYDYPSWNF